jgi:nucleoside-diphosphate-sugar epimerase
MYLSALDLYFDASKAEQELGFTSRSAKEAVSEAVSWYARYSAA